VKDEGAFARSVNRFGRTRKDGERIVDWLRLTSELRKIDGRCKFVHEHVSVPFDMKTGRTMLNKAKIFHVTRGARAPT
jgi:ketosteroid isomerase-like protein